MTRLDAIRRRLEASMDGEAGIVPQDLRDLLELAEAVMDQQRAVREPTSKKNLNDAIMRTELAMRRLDAPEVEG